MKIILMNGSSIPLYEQIKTAIKENIMTGILHEDQQLPSVRELSKDLKVSILTVKKAYDGLEQEGFIVSRQGLGTFVSSHNSSLHREEKLKKIEAHLLEAVLISKAIELSEEEFKELVDYLYRGEDQRE